MGECHECSCFVNPPCGACENCKHWYVDDCPNDCQLCDYDHERTGPYRLADGTWSDGVDRSVRIIDMTSRETHPTRIYVFHCFEGWVVDQEEPWTSTPGFPTHAEAIAYADRMARTNQGENK